MASTKLVWDQPQPQLETDTESSTVITTHKLEAALRRVSVQAAQYESEMKDLESKLSEGLSNFRAIDSFLQEAFTVLRRNTRRAERSKNRQLPDISAELEECNTMLKDLSQTLPTIQNQVADLRTVYDSGRKKARSLVADLTWLNTEFYERWRTIIFTSSSPVSWRWKAFMRFLFAVSFLICSWITWIALLGAYRAYRYKLVWGERLMS
ncbi:hypothetical protein IW261DRAFT_1442474 [Armillaria novae-zelandiae]|uniref:Uncharacterized protein n=1 Tax=Armillaria novae-zelandiae TaxID=153914 RepID=A0AA39THH1_9AGAR|nr:hypothetical protein IW261DRAFT_1442474 [Armillaria novae-zelandiae]